ncbi:MAG: hypothetical protein NTY00_10390 [Deltaproteobacteria bacterium]|nr:hypothetical protein [Deltaproteobacteria bacterium]
MFIDLADTESIDFRQLFSPSTGFYYRPLLMISFIIDKFLWGLEPSFMHLENIMLHACNTILVFFIAKQVCSEPAKNNFELPLLAALFFALHPVNTESVNWISGRTDLLGTAFTLLSVVLLLKGTVKHSSLFVVLSSFCLVLGIMSKEIMLFFYPVGCGLLFFWPSLSAPLKPERNQRLKFLLFFSLPFLTGGILYLFFRILLFSQNDQGARHLSEFPQYFSWKMVTSTFKIFGFYVKKLFFPLPLNFAITKISSYYIWIGLGSFFLTVFLIIKRSITSIFFFIAFYLITPAIIIGITGVTWTPIAERYLYLASAFWSIGLATLLFQFINRGQKQKIITALCIICLLFSSAFITSNRNIQWQDNVTLYADTILKNPDFSAINNEYAIALIDAGQLAAAEEQLTAGINNPGNKSPLLYINLARIKIEQNNLGEARQVLFRSFTTKEEAHPEVLKMLSNIDEKRIMTGDYKDESAKRILIMDLLDTYTLIYNKTKNPHARYRFGQLALSIGLKAEARAAFASAYKEAPNDAYYKKAAGIMAQKLTED